MVIGIPKWVHGALLLAAFGASPALAAKAPRSFCSEGTFQATPAIVDGAPAGDTLLLQGGRATIIDAASSVVVCPPTDIVTLRATARGTMLKARWCRCQGQGLHVSALLAASDCRSLTKGKAKPANDKVRAFTAVCADATSPSPVSDPDAPACAPPDTGSSCPVNSLVMAMGEGGSQGVIVIPAGGALRDLPLPPRRKVSFGLDSAIPAGTKAPTLLFTRQICIGGQLGTSCPYTFALPDPVRVQAGVDSFDVKLPDGEYSIAVENDCAVAFEPTPLDPVTGTPITFAPLVVKGDRGDSYFRHVRLNPRPVFAFAGTVAGLPVGSGPVNVAATGPDPDRCETSQTGIAGSGSGTTATFSLTLPAGDTTVAATSSSPTCATLYYGTGTITVSPTTTTTVTTVTVPVGTTTTTTLVTVTVGIQAMRQGVLSDRLGNHLKGVTIEAVPDPVADPVGLSTDLNAPCPTPIDGSYAVGVVPGHEYLLLATSDQVPSPRVPFQILPASPSSIALRQGKLLQGRITGQGQNDVATMTAYAFQRVVVAGTPVCVPYKGASPRNDAGKNGRVYAANVLPGASQGSGGCVTTTSSTTVPTTTSLTLQTTTTSTTSTTTIP